MKHYQLKNGRTINDMAYHDLFCDGIMILEKEDYNKIFVYVLQNGEPDDFYSEPDACPKYKGETVAELRKKWL